MQIGGSRVLLTGASGGIGQAIATALRERGAQVLASGRRVEELERAGEPLECDLSDREAVAALPERAGRVDVLVANAGLPSSGLLSALTEEQIDRALDVNLRAPILLAHALAPGMAERGSGHLVFVSSLNGKSAAAGTTIYSATKFGLRGFASALRDDLHGSGVGVTTIFPGFISDAGMFHDAGVDLPPGVATRTPQQVAAGVIRGIEADKHEVDVAPFSLRASAKFAGAFPELAARVQRKLGSRELAEKMARAQAGRR
ncbi:MAG: SDR family NAD(P)-dependent oxidoreductase [Thermoleophilaceae bacterium]|nr:SDR family NAD(P)-dependent oxidoreductase [Thermoleophilaceae bacterium]